MTTSVDGRYRLRALLAESEQGQQYLAQDTKLGRTVLLNLLPPSPPEARWARIRRLTTLTHPHLAQIYDFKLGEGDVPLVVTEAVAPELVAELPLTTAVSQFIQLADALALAHENGLTHGPVSPRSIRYLPHKNGLLWADWPLTSPAPEALPAEDVRQLVALLRHTAVEIPPPLDTQLDALLAHENPTATDLAHILRTAVLPDLSPAPEPEPAPSPDHEGEPLPPPRLSLRLATPLLTLTPGEATVTTAVLVNEANIVLHVTPRLLGLPASWLTFDPPLLQLLPQEEAELRLTITPPRRSEARAGQYAFEWQMLSVEHEGQVATTAVGQALMRPFVQVATSALQPSQLKNHGRVAFTLHNQSNRVVTGQITGVDQSGQLLLGGLPTSYTLEPDEETICTVAARPRHRPLVGTSERLPFTIHLTAEEDDLPPLTGQLDNRPYLPLWALPLASLLLLFGCMAGFFLYSNAQNRAVVAAAQAEARRNEQNVAATLTRSALEIILVQTPPTPTFPPPTLIPTLTPRLVFTPTPSQTPTLEPALPPDQDTATPTFTPSPSLTPSVTPGLTGTVTLTPTVALTMTVTATITGTPALTLTTTPAITVTPEITGTVPVTVTPTLDGVEAARPVEPLFVLHATVAESVILNFKRQARPAKRFALRALQA